MSFDPGGVGSIAEAVVPPGAARLIQYLSSALAGVE